MIQFEQYLNDKRAYDKKIFRGQVDDKNLLLTNDNSIYIVN